MVYLRVRRLRRRYQTPAPGPAYQPVEAAREGRACEQAVQLRDVAVRLLLEDRARLAARGLMRVFDRLEPLRELILRAGADPDHLVHGERDQQQADERQERQ